MTVNFTGADTITVQEGATLNGPIVTFDGNDTITGDADDNVLGDGFGSDRLDGGPGDDTFRLEPDPAPAMNDKPGSETGTGTARSDQPQPASAAPPPKEPRPAEDRPKPAQSGPPAGKSPGPASSSKPSVEVVRDDKGIYTLKPADNRPKGEESKPPENKPDDAGKERSSSD